MTLVERDRELATLVRTYTECLGGEGRVALVSGAVGIGKTALLHVFTEQAIDSGALFLSAAASRAERNLPLGVLSQLFHHLTLSREDSDTVRRLLGERELAATANGPESPASEQAVYAFYRLCDILLALGKQRPIVIGVDDVQYTDISSLRCLHYLVRRLRKTRIMLIVSECVSHAKANPLFSAEFLRQPQAQRIRLGALSRSSVADLLTARLGVSATPELAATWYTATGGNPLLVNALVEDYLASGSSGIVFGLVFSQAVAACLCGVGGTALSIAQALAVLGDDVPPTLVGDLLGVNAETVSRAIDALNGTRLLDNGCFRHEVVRKVVLDGMEPESRAATHRRAASVLHCLGAPAPVLARHLVAAGTAVTEGTVDEKWVVPTLREAADHALAEGETDQATGYLRVAAHACADERERAMITAELMQAEWRVDPSKAIRRIPELASAARAGHLEGSHAVRPVGHLLWVGRAKEAIEILGTLQRLNESKVPPNAETAAELDATRLWLRFFYPGLVGHVEGDREAPGDLRAATASPHLKAALTLTTVLANGPDEGTLAAAEQLLESANLGEVARTTSVAMLLSLILSDKWDRAAFWCDHLLAKAANSRMPTGHAVLAATRAMIDVYSGDFTRAEEHADSALTRISPKAWGVAIGFPLAAMLLATTATGQHAKAAGYLTVPVPDAMFRTPYGLTYLHARGRYYYAINRRRAAVRDFEACGELMGNWGIDIPTLVPWRIEVAQAYLGSGNGPGNKAQARDFADEQLARLSPFHGRARGVTLRVLAEASGLDSRQPLLREAAEILRTCGDRFELARTLAALSRTHHALGDHGEAQEFAHRARLLAEQCGVQPLSPTPLTALGTGTARPPAARDRDPGTIALPWRRDTDAPDAAPFPSRSPEPYAPAPHAVEATHPYEPGAELLAVLSEAERRVAALAARGCTNRQIATKLYITVSTVEQHLTRVYRKLRVNRRGDLPKYLLRPVLDPMPDNGDANRRPADGNCRS
jgi:DNA-binding CsgD family transcriptional regulator